MSNITKVSIILVIVSLILMIGLLLKTKSIETEYKKIDDLYNVYIIDETGVGK